jgi:hypothetical protein
MLTMTRSRILLLLRIAVSVVCLTLCIAFVALWVRSYQWIDSVGGPFSQTQRLLAWSSNGGLVIQVNFHPWGYNWYLTHTPLFQSGSSHSAFRFGSEFRLQKRGVELPHWFIVVLTATVAAAPWLPRSRRFSLRTLLLATTLVAVVLGLVVTIG